MSVVNLAVLKARYATGDKPTAKDWIDLIDTLAAAATLSGVTPTGPAGGDLSGNYPNPAIKADGAVDGNRPIVNNMIRNKTIQPVKIDVSGASSGDSIQYDPGTNSAVWGAVGASVTTVGGMLTADLKDLILLPDTDGPPAGFPVTLPGQYHNSMPQFVRWVAVCIQAFADYDLGDEVPIERFVLSSSPATPCFYPTTSVVSGDSVLSMRVEYGTLSAGTGFAVYPRDNTANAIVAHANDGAAHPKLFWKLRAYYSRFEAGNGFGCVTEYIGDEAIPADNAETTTLTHSFHFKPTMCGVWLVCTTTDGAYAVGDEVPIDEACDTDGSAAFSVRKTAMDVLVRRTAANVKLYDAAGALVTITPASWKIRVYAHRTINVPSKAFPSLSMMLSNPMGAISVKDFMIALNYGTAGTKSFLSKINLVTGATTRITTYNPAKTNGNFAIFKFPKSDGAGGPINRVVFSTQTSAFNFLNINNLSTIGSWDCSGTGDNVATLKPVFFVDLAGDTYGSNVTGSANASAATPDIYSVSSNYGTGSLDSVSLYKHKWNGSSYVRDTGYPKTVNFRTGITGLADYIPAASQILMFSYNHLKKRIYLLENNSGILHILKLGASANNVADLFFSTNVSNASFVTLEKRVCIMGSNGGYWSDILNEHPSVEFDPDTGDEIAVVLSNRGTATGAGSVVRIPWIE